MTPHPPVTTIPAVSTWESRVLRRCLHFARGHRFKGRATVNPPRIAGPRAREDPES